MTKEKNAVRTFTILYTLPSNRMFVHRFTTDKPVMAELKYKWLTSVNGSKTPVEKLNMSKSQQY